MNIIPAIDIKDGKVVRLLQGAANKVTVYSDSPVDVAKRWSDFGINLLHVVDLDGAFTGELKNLEIVKEMISQTRLMVELGGGIRDEETIKRVLDARVDKVVLGTKALDMDFLANISAKYKGRIVAGIDAKDGYVCTKGWVESTDTKAADLANYVQAVGVTRIIYTDISRDGMLMGPNIQSLEDMLASVDIEVIASGGVSYISDIAKLMALKYKNLVGVIVGKALYEGKIDLGEAVRLCSQKE